MFLKEWLTKHLEECCQKHDREEDLGLKITLVSTITFWIFTVWSSKYIYTNNVKLIISYHEDGIQILSTIRISAWSMKLLSLSYNIQQYLTSAWLTYITLDLKTLIHWTVLLPLLSDKYFSIDINRIENSTLSFKNYIFAQDSEKR